MSYYRFPTGRTVWYFIFASLLTELEKAGKIESLVTKDAWYTSLISIEMIMLPTHLHGIIVPNGQYDGQDGARGPYNSLETVSLISLFQKSFPVILVTLSRVLDL